MKSASHKISRARLVRVVNSLRGRRIVVLGDWMLDRYVWGAAERISPEAPVPVVNFAKQSECLGGAGNVAANLASLGARVVPFGVLGDDEPAAALRRCVHSLGLSGKGLVADSSRPTTLKTRIIARQQQVVRVDREVRSPVAGAIEERLIRSVLAALHSADALIISDYDKGAVTDEVADRVLQKCQRFGVPAFVKPKWSRLPTYRGATAIVCNRAEAGFLVTRSLDIDSAVEEAGRALLAHFACAGVVITRGAQGLTLCEHDNPRAFHTAAVSRERPLGFAGEAARDSATPGRQVFDVTGAGDTVLATLSLVAAAGGSLREGAILGNFAAGVVVGKLGTATVTPPELLAVLRDIC